MKFCECETYCAMQTKDDFLTCEKCGLIVDGCEAAGGEFNECHKEGCKPCQWSTHNVIKKMDDGKE